MKMTTHKSDYLYNLNFSLDQPDQFREVKIHSWNKRNDENTCSVNFHEFISLKIEDDSVLIVKYQDGEIRMDFPPDVKIAMKKALEGTKNNLKSK